MTQTFSNLGLDDRLVEAIQKKGFKEPTEIQVKAIPLVLEGKDVLATSSTGSGKTLAFGFGMLQKIQPKQGIQGLVLAPTRELAEQIALVLKDFAKPLGLRTTAIFGGVSLNPQANALRSAEIVVATPGRLLDHLQRGSVDLSCITHLVLDEADRMLDMGFLPDVKKILQQLPHRRQLLLFTATLPAEISALAKEFMNDPKNIKAGVYVDPKKLDQVYYDVPGPMKFSLLVHLLKEEKDGLVMVFCNSRKYTDQVANGLTQEGFDAMAIHGGLTQQARQKVLKRFHQAHVFVLVCTDVAARGLDIPGVGHVYNYDIPNDSKQYVHRIGRTARAGEAGKVINLISSRDYDNFSFVLRDNDLEIKKEQKPFIKKIELPTGGVQRSTGNFRKGSSQDRGGHDEGRSRAPRTSRGPSRSGSSRASGSSPSRGPRRASRSEERAPRSSHGRFGSDPAPVHDDTSRGFRSPRKKTGGRSDQGGNKGRGPSRSRSSTGSFGRGTKRRSGSGN